MTDQIPYADYVRIVIHAAGKAQIIEFKKDDDWDRIRAQVTVEDRMTRDALIGPMVRTLPVGGIRMNVAVTGPKATRIFKDSDR